MKRKLPVEIESFEEIRREEFYYVDKSYLIRELLNSWGKGNLFPRPRRFGKTLNMSMLKCFLSWVQINRCLMVWRLRKRRNFVKNIWGNSQWCSFL